MVAITKQQREAIQKGKAKAAEKIKKEVAKQAKKEAAKAEKARKRREDKAAYEAKGPVPVSTVGLREVEVEVSWEERSGDEKLPQIRGTDGKLPIKLGCEGGVVFWKLDKKRLENFIKAERDPRMTQRYKLILKEAAKLKLLC